MGPTSERTGGLYSGFMQSAERFPDRPALEVGGESLSYRVLRDRAAAIASTLRQESPQDGPPLTAVFAHRSATAFAGVLAALSRGHGYVPLNRRLPVDRTRMMLRRSGCRAVVADRESAKQLDQILGQFSEPLLIVVPDLDDSVELAKRWPLHKFVDASRLNTAKPSKPELIPVDGIAYLLFTSGSTGTPKGVMVAHRNVMAFVDVMVERYGITENDRFSQTFDLNFDLSAFDMFVAWECGACVCCPSTRTLIKPGRFIQDAYLTVWFSVPSTGVFMRRFGMLKPDRYPTLRWSLFCGEPLPLEVARAWTQAAPNSTLENLYGPTELTIACTAYRWDAERSPSESEYGVVPIGQPFPGMTALVVNEHLREVEPGGEGELLMTGKQLTLGYWGAPEITSAAYVVPPGEERVFYRTGDRVSRPAGNQPMLFRGRLDDQIKVLGMRVELGEVEAVVREESGLDAVVALGWPPTLSGADGVVVFIGDDEIDTDPLRARVAARLPEHMVPRQFRLLAELPLNANGKFDRRALREMLEVEAGSASGKSSL
jgi:amino acid adenylation domain-containing protein